MNESSTTILTPFQGRGATATAPPAVPQPLQATTQPPSAVGAPFIDPSNLPPPPSRPALHSFHENLKDRVLRGQRGTIIMSPSRIIAPVGSEVVVLAGICGGDGHYAVNQPLEWMLSQDSAGQIVEVGGTDHRLSNQLIKPSAAKIDGDYAWGRTQLKPRLITRGTPTEVDDIQVEKGQAWISLSSASEGTSYLTCVAPKAEAWDKRRASSIIHWVDGTWMIPAPARATAGSVFPLTVAINRTSDGTGVQGWKVSFQIVGGAPAEFMPGGAQQAEIITGSTGQATMQLRQAPGQVGAGTTQVRVDIIRPAMYGEREWLLESGLTAVTWSSPALSIRAIGPRSAAIDQAFNYRIEVTNPGDQVARGVVVRGDGLGTDLQFISSEPKPAQFGNQFQWDLGDVQPGSPARMIDVQLKSSTPGVVRPCFQVTSQSDQLQTEACAETEIVAPCIGLRIDGPTTARAGEQIDFNFEITNQCQTPLEDVMVRVQYDAGLQAPRMSNPIEFGPLGTPIQFGEKRQTPTLTFVAQQPGTHCFTLSITAKGGHTATARRCVEVTQVSEPRVQLQMESHRLVRVGEQVLVRMTVTNVGPIPLDNVTVINQFARSMVPVRRSPVPQRWIGDDLAFDIGRLEPNARSVIEIVFDTVAPDGDAFSRATVTTPGGASDTTGVTIRIEPAGADVSGADQGEFFLSGSPATMTPASLDGTLRVGVSALTGRLHVGGQCEVQIQVTNDRGVTDQQVRIGILVPAELQLLGIDEQQAGLRLLPKSDDRLVYELETRQELRPGESIDFTATLLATGPGSSTIAVQARSDRSPQPVEGRDQLVITP